MNQKTIKIVIPVLVLGLSLTSYFILKEEKPTKVLSEKEKFYQFMEGDTNLYESKIKSQIKAKNKIFPEIFNELLKSDFRTASIASLACFPFSDFQEQILKFNEKDMGVYISNFSCRYYSADLSALDKIASLGHSREQKLENLRNLMEWNKTSASFKPIRLNQIVLPYYLKEFKNSDEVFKILAEYENS
ncbi:MAG: hypothetical protein VX642_01855, partial [Bdellovibrionota bacterium]|nr:hypothetical protein [Bdellovibrionota bacterium]